MDNMRVDKVKIGKRIADLIHDARIERSEIALRLGLKDPGSISKWIRGINSPRGEHLINLADILNTSPDYILTGEKAPPHHPAAQNKAPDDDIQYMRDALTEFKYIYESLKKQFDAQEKRLEKQEKKIEFLEQELDGAVKIADQFREEKELLRAKMQNEQNALQDRIRELEQRLLAPPESGCGDIASNQ